MGLFEKIVGEEMAEEIRKEEVVLYSVLEILFMGFMLELARIALLGFKNEMARKMPTGFTFLLASSSLPLFLIPIKRRDDPGMAHDRFGIRAFGGFSGQGPGHMPEMGQEQLHRLVPGHVQTVALGKVRVGLFYTEKTTPN
jgi:hypothetical protein